MYQKGGINMEIDRKILLNKLSTIEGLVQNTINSIEENELLNFIDIKDMATIIKEQLLETKEYIKNA